MLNELIGGVDVGTVAATVSSSLVIFLWEHFLGKTKKIDANSTGALVAGVVKKLIGKLFKR